MKETSVKKNYLYDMTYHIMTFFIPLITAPYISRVLGSAGVGIYSYLLSIQTYFSMFTSLGTSVYGARVIAQCRDDKNKLSKSFWEIELLTVFVSLFTISTWILLSIIYRSYTSYLLILTLSILSVTFDISWLYAGLEQYKIIAIRNTFFKVIGAVMLFSFVKKQTDLIYYFYINAFISLFSSLSLWIKLKEQINPVKISQLKIKPHLKETLIYFIPTIATSVYSVLDKTLIGIITEDSSQNGYYEQANQIINIAKTISFGSINTVLTTRLSYLYACNKYDEIRKIIISAVDFVLFFAWGCSFGIIGIAKNFVPLYFGDGYLPVIKLLYLLSPIVIIISISSCLGSQYYIPFGKRSESAKYLIVGSILNLLLNILLIPLFSAIGATISTIVAELLIAFLYLNNCDRYLTFRDVVEYSGKKFLSGFLMCFVIIIIGNMLTEISLIYRVAIQLLLGAVIYVGLLLCLKDTAINYVLSSLKRRIIK